MVSMQLRCATCDAVFDSDIQLPRDVYERSSLEGNVQPCAACGAPVELSDQTVLFPEPDTAEADSGRN